MMGDILYAQQVNTNNQRPLRKGLRVYVMKAVFLDHNTFDSAINLDAIKAQVTQLTCFAHTKTEEIITRSFDAEIVITNKVVFTEAILSALPNLKLICISATGYNNVDIDAANRLNIAVTNVSGYSTTSVSQYVFAQLLEYYQKTSHHNKNTEQGLWQTSDSFCYHGHGFNELAGKTLGIVGYGNLGKAVEKIALAFQMKVLISDRPNASTIRAQRTPFEQVLEQSDIVSLHCPHTPDNENLINEETLGRMKKTAVLINTARGALVDEQALHQAIKDNKIAYAILDVLKQEPPSASHPLIQAQLPQIKITAHIAWASMESQQRLFNLLAENIQAYKNNSSLNRLC